MTYKLCQRMIENQTYENKSEMQETLDVFLAYRRFTADQYEELTKLLAAQPEDKAN